MMKPIYHLVPGSAWEGQAGEDYRADSLATQGFIHCSFAGQLAWAANRFHAETPDLIALEIDPAKLTSPLKVEPPSPTSKTAEVFPHIYGPLNRSAVTAEQPMRRGDDGRWVFPDQ
jgi:uncharacterized protein (DUF952 family)